MKALFTVFLLFTVNILSQSISIIEPNGGENWNAGLPYSIRWSDNLTEKVKIELYKGGSFDRIVIDSTESDGYFAWNIPVEILSGSNYKIKINSIINSSIFDFSDADFTITGRSINITAPNGGESWNAGSSYPITWTDNIPEKIKIELYKGGSLFTVLSDSTESDGYFVWNIPINFQAGTDYKIKLTSILYNFITDTSTGFFSIIGKSITVLSPNGGENWNAGTNVSITWNDNITEKLKIELYKGGTLFSTIADSTESDGYFAWTVPIDAPTGSDYRIKLTSILYGFITDSSDNDFSITGKTISVTSPNGGENLNAGAAFAITWTDNISEKVRIELYKGGSLHSVISDSTDSDGHFAWSIPIEIATGNDYKIKITSILYGFISDFSDNDFIIVGKTIAITFPNGGETLNAGATIAITWTDNISEKVKIELYKDAILHSVISDSTESDSHFLWTLPIDISTGADYKIKITSILYSFINDFSDNDFSINGKIITITFPNGGDTLVAGSLNAITWTDNISEKVRIELYKGGLLHSIISDSTESDGYYPWQIPIDLGTASNYKIKISSVLYEFITDFSDNDFIINGKTITVISPNGGDTLAAGSVKAITWTDNISEKVRIELYKGGIFHSTISDSTESDGHFSWSIPVEISEGNDYKIKISSILLGFISDFSDNNFIILGKILTVISPNGGDTLYAGTTKAVTWTDNINEMIRIELYKGGAFYSIISDSTESDGHYAWSVPIDIEGGNDFRIKITSILYSFITDFSDNDFMINVKTITITLPNGGETLNAGSNQAINWTDNISEQVKIELYKTDIPLLIITDSTDSDGHFVWNIPVSISSGNDYKIKISSILYPFITDLSDNDFIINGKSIAITSPNGGDTLNAGQTKAITWTDNISEKVKIELFKGNILHSVIADSTESDGHFPWAIPIEISTGDDYKIKISSIIYNFIFDFSDNNFRINGKILTVTSPNGGDTLNAGATKAVTWTDNITEKVRIELFKGGFLHSTISDSTESDGHFAWIIPIEISSGNDYKIKITSILHSFITDYSDNNFMINGKILTVTSPNGGDTLNAGALKAITWTDNIPEKVRIELFKGGVLNSVISDSTDSDGHYTWDIPFTMTSGNDYKIKITSILYSFITDYSDNNFLIAGKEITITQPVGGETWNAGSSYAIKWTDNLSGKVGIELFKGNLVENIISDSTESDGYYLWTIPVSIQTDSSYRVKITSLTNNNIFDFSDSTFKIIGKEVKVTVPNGGEEWKAGFANSIRWTDNFGEKVSIQLFKGNTIYLIISDSTESDGFYAWTVDDTLVSGNDYKIKIINIKFPSIADLSDSSFTVIGKVISITEPNGGEIWEPGTSYPITWTDNFPEKIVLQLFRGEQYYSTISDSTESDGYFAWTPPDTIDFDSIYKIKIYSIRTNKIFDMSDTAFSIKYITDISKEDLLPVEFSMSQNYPNPFNPSTIISYALPREIFVELIVYNILGEQMEVLIREIKPAGYYSFKYNGSTLPSGVYLYRITAGDFTRTMKMIVVK